MSWEPAGCKCGTKHISMIEDQAYQDKECTEMDVFIFPGQGSQRRGMGQDLFDEVQEFKAIEADIDALLGYSLRDLCLAAPDNLLGQTQFTQPSLYVINALYFYRERSKGSCASYLAGHSLGEYNALHAAGAFDFLTGLRLVKKRGELMAQTKNGAMAAVIGLQPEKLEEVLRERGLATLDIANYNAPLQTVISGSTADIEHAKPILEETGAKMYIRLPVSAAFHSRYMVDTASLYSDFLSHLEFNEIKIPVISNVTGKPYPIGCSTEKLRALLVEQIYKPVLWVQSIKYLNSQGISRYKELGPGNILTKLIGQIKKN
jgi:malonyl CoA-acyl carrier protein transacylase